MDIVCGDIVEWVEPVWPTYRPGWGGRRARQPQPIGERTVRARVLRESYGPRTGQHTFTLEVLAASGCKPPVPGSLIRRMGRNLYGRVLEHTAADDAGRAARVEDKHRRGDAARKARYERMVIEEVR